MPRALWLGWIGGAALGLATAGVAGALIMRSAETSPVETGATPHVAAVAVQPAPPSAVPVPTRVVAAPTRPRPVSPPTPEVAVAKVDTKPIEATAPVASPCANCGVVESVTAVQQKGQASGLGAVAGGVVGGVVGHQVGGGNGKTAMTVLGAIGGGLAGNEVEKRVRAETLYNVQVRMADGSTRSFQQAQSLAVGTRVVVEGSRLRVGSDLG